MGTLSKNIKQLLVVLAANDELPLDMTTLDESIFDEVLNENGLREGLVELNCNVELVVNVGWVNDALSEVNSERNTPIDLTDEDKVDYLFRIDLQSFDGSIKEMLKESIEADYEEDEWE